MNAVTRDLFDSVTPWPRTLPRPQVDSVQVNWAAPTEDAGTLAGPSRFRRTKPNASPSYEFELWFTAAECEAFEAWYNMVVDAGGEIYLPWIGEGRILYLNEYELTPYLNGWKLHGLAVQLYRDPTYCDRHVCDAADAWRMPVIVDADADFPIILCELPSQLWRPRLIDSFYSRDPIARLTATYGPTASLTAHYPSADRVIADLGAADVWNGHTLLAVVDVIVADLSASFVWNGHTLSWFAELTDVVICTLDASNVFVDIPENWMWDAQAEDWYAKNRMVYIDDWETLAWDAARCRLVKDLLPPPYPIVMNSDWTLTRIIANRFPLETYTSC